MRVNLKQLRRAQQMRLKEDINVYGTSIYGTLIPDWSKLYSYRGQPLMPVFGRDIFPYKSTTVRQLQDYNRVMQQGRWLYETNSSAHGLISGLRSFVIGQGFTVKIAAKKENEAKRLVKRVQEIIDEFREENDVFMWERELFVRSHRDGEVFLRMFPNFDECTQIRAIEPDQVRPPAGESWEGAWSFGIETRIDDWQDPIRYCVWYWNETPDIVEGHFIKHLKNNVSRNTKRGLSSFYPVFDELDGAAKLRYAMREGEKIRQSMAYVRQYSNADRSSIAALQASFQTDTAHRTDGQGSEYEVAVQKIEPGSVVDIPVGLEYQNPPSVESAPGVEILAASLQAVAARFNAPAWLVTGNADASSYASAVVAESPFVGRILHEQALHTKYWKDIYEAIIEIEIEKGELPEDVLDQIDIHVTAPNPLSRNKKDVIEADLALVNAGVMSDATLAARNDLDLEEELAKGASKQLDPAKVTAKTGSAPETMSGQRQKEVPQPEN